MNVEGRHRLQTEPSPVPSLLRILGGGFELPAWPSMIWHLYDYSLQPAGAYFGAKRALEPLHPIYGYDDRPIWLVSSQYKDVKGLKLTTKIYNLDATEKFSHENAVDAPADSTAKILTLPDLPGLTATYFLALRLTDSAGQLVGSNFYWLSTKAEAVDWAKSTWWKTETAQFADYTALSSLVSEAESYRAQRQERARHPAQPEQEHGFFVRLKVNKGAAGREILPVVWNDNYISLLPGEKRETVASYRASDLARIIRDF